MELLQVPRSSYRTLKVDLVPSRFDAQIDVTCPLIDILAYSPDLVVLVIFEECWKLDPRDSQNVVMTMFK